MGKAGGKRFARRLLGGPHPERIRDGSEVEFDRETRRELEEKFRLLERARMEAWVASHDYVIGGNALGLRQTGDRQMRQREKPGEA